MNDLKNEEALRVHRSSVKARIAVARQNGARSLDEILSLCDGADPRLVVEILREQGAALDTAVATRAPIVAPTWAFALPAADPERSQWWCSTAGLAKLQRVVAACLATRPRDAAVLCLGCPSVAASLRHGTASVFACDVDSDVVEAIHRINPEAEVQAYDANEDLPTTLRQRFAVTVVDPPWYDDLIETFLSRALAATVVGGDIISTLPGRLTRPGIEESRARLIADMVQRGHEIVALEPGVVQYQVPAFEMAALRDIKNFGGMPWRLGDLLHLRRGGGNLLPAKPRTVSCYATHGRQKSQFRVFVREAATGDARVPVRHLESYSSNVSTRSHNGERPDIWTTEKRGVVVSNIEAASLVITTWAGGGEATAAVAAVEKKLGSGSRDYGDELVRALDDSLGLWKHHAASAPFRTQQEIEEARRDSLSEFATNPSARAHREHNDGFRPNYSRDRDRILWSAGFRRLSDKTQLFPSAYDDDLRRRLTHSVEVMQLATTIGASFGLDRDLIEAGSLGHDIGHTPFGHAGEHALSAVLTRVHSEFRGFNHYEHGLDVIRVLEGPYHFAGGNGFRGLNLTPEVCECVIKHAYCHAGSKISTAELLKASKHRNFVVDGYCHLEGQAVRLADKVSYLVSDLEDGIRIGAIERRHLLSCRFFHRPPLDFSEAPDQTLDMQFLDQRRMVLKILMEDAIRASSKRLARLGRGVEAVRSADRYTIDHSEELASEVDEIWNRLQSAVLHKDQRVVSANLHAARIVSTLLVAYTVLPESIDARFRAEHERARKGFYTDAYRRFVGSHVTIPTDLLTNVPVDMLVGSAFQPGTGVRVPVEHLVMAKDYVASFTDSHARGSYARIVTGGEG